MAEVEDELEQIRRELVEVRGLVIKTNHLTNALGADIKTIAKKQQSYERKVSWNGATSYVAFVVVVFVALKFAVDARVDAIEAKYLHLGHEGAKYKEEIDQLKEREKARNDAEMRAHAFYDLVHQGKDREVVEAWEGVSKQPITKAERAAFADAVERSRVELSSSTYQHALDKMRLERWQEAATLLESSLRYKVDSPLSPSVKLSLATCYRHLKRLPEATPLLVELTDQSVDKEVQDDALYLLAYTQMDTQAYNDAKNTWRLLLKRFPDSKYAQEGKLRLAELNLQH